MAEERQTPLRRGRRRESGRSIAAALAALIAIFVLSSPAPAATTITVTSNADSGPGTLRAALASAGAGDTILIPGSFTIVLTTPLTVTQPAPGGITIGASGSGRPTISGNHATGIFQTNANTALTVNGLILTEGNSGGDGSGIAAGTAATVNVNDSVLSDNGSSNTFGDGGAIELGNNGALSVERSTISGNHGGTSSGDGGAIGALFPSTVTVDASTFSDNHAGAATGNGGAVQLGANTTLTVTNTTFFGNLAGLASGVGGAIQTSSAKPTTLLNVTISGNQAALRGGGISADGSGVTASNTIISGNTSPTGPNCFGPTSPPIASAGHNLEDGTSCGFAGPGDQNANPLLDAALRDNGGPTPTLALLAGSRAINAGGPGCPETDQRGAPRNACDIGAYERLTCGGFAVNRIGTDGPDTLVGTAGRDGILGLGGKDKLKGLGDKDGLCGGAGKDILKGGPGRDVLVGGKGRDVLIGGRGRDRCRGGPGRDVERSC